MYIYIYIYIHAHIDILYYIIGFTLLLWLLSFLDHPYLQSWKNWGPLPRLPAHDCPWCLANGSAGRMANLQDPKSAKIFRDITGRRNQVAIWSSSWIIGIMMFFYFTQTLHMNISKGLWVELTQFALHQSNCRISWPNAEGILAPRLSTCCHHATVGPRGLSSPAMCHEMISLAFLCGAFLFERIYLSQWAQTVSCCSRFPMICRDQNDHQSLKF